MESSPSPLRLSIIIEWENVRLSELDRSERMLAGLLSQLRNLLDRETSGSAEDRFLARFQRPVELLVLYNSEDFSEDEVAATLRAFVHPDNPDVSLRFVGAADTHYYELKNVGAQEASGDYILFLDSDVIPEDGWLEAMLRPLVRDEIDVVGGYCYIDPVDLISKAFAIAWFFNLPGSTGAPHPAPAFYANNVVFPRDLFLRYPFPKLREGVSRKACSVLSDTLNREGVGLYKNPEARVSHPPPNGWSHFFVRALAQGRDNLYFDYGEPERAPARSLLRRLRRQMKRTHRRVRQHRAAVNVSTVEVPFIYGIAGAYYLTYMVGAGLTKVRPSFMLNRFHI